ncbi:MAG: Rieske 2Fe-2S domain-containing protein [Rhodobacteraceae bacterium]|nr:Rieske 2Fe-2S domain-containing protein [Paracoccaceae bacterium]
MADPAPIPAELQIDAPQTWVRLIESAALDMPRPLIPVRLNGKRLVLFRDEAGSLGLIGRNCPHRGADLCYGRLEDNGLRCPFHGWHFDHTGQCVEQPAEPEDSQMYKAIKIPMIPVEERDGSIWAYLGTGSDAELIKEAPA